MPGKLAVWHLAIESFVNGLGWATDNPVRRVMIGEVVGSDQMGTAMSLDVGASNASRMVGPTIGGLLLAGIGIQGAFTLSVVLYGVALYGACRVSLPQHRAGQPRRRAGAHRRRACDWCAATAG